MKKLIALVLTLIVVTATLSGCSKGSSNPLIGTWYCAEVGQSITFKSEGTYTAIDSYDYSGKYTVEGDEITFTSRYSEMHETFTITEENGQTFLTFAAKQFSLAGTPREKVFVKQN